MIIDSYFITKQILENWQRMLELSCAKESDARGKTRSAGRKNNNAADVLGLLNLDRYGNQ